MTRPIRLQLPAHLQWTAAGLGIVLVVLGSLRLVYLPLFGRLRTQQAILQEIRVKLADAKEAAARLTMQEQLQRQAAQRVEALQGWVMKEQALARILDYLRLQANELGLDLKTTQLPDRSVPEQGIVPQPLGSGVVVRQCPLTLSVVGRYRRLGELLEKLHDAPFLAEVDGMAVQPVQDRPPELEATIQLTIYLAKDSLT